MPIEAFDTQARSSSIISFHSNSPFADRSERETRDWPAVTQDVKFSTLHHGNRERRRRIHVCMFSTIQFVCTVFSRRCDETSFSIVFSNSDSAQIPTAAAAAAHKNRKSFKSSSASSEREREMAALLLLSSCLPLALQPIKILCSV